MFVPTDELYHVTCLKVLQTQTNYVCIYLFFFFSLYILHSQEYNNNNKTHEKMILDEPTIKP